MESLEWALDHLSSMIAVTVGVAMFILGAVLIRRWYLMRRLNDVSGRIVELRLRQHWDDEGEYAVEMTYEYVVRGKKVRRRTEDDNRIARLYSLAAAERVKRQMEQQREILVRYDPARPGEAVAGEAKSQSLRTGLGMLVSGSVLLLVAAHLTGVVDLAPYFRPLTSLFPS